MKEAIKKIAEQEGIDVDVLKEKIASGRVVVPLNFSRNNIPRPAAIGEGMTVKVNANIGGSPELSDINREIEKLRVAVECGADTVMDLSIGKGWQRILERVLDESPVPVGTVPVYGVFCVGKGIEELSDKDFIDIIEKQGKMGVDFMTIHAGVCRRVVETYDKSSRIGGVVSRGGKLLYRWMKKNSMENPLYSRFDEVLEIAAEYNITLSLGDGLRPGCIADASDEPQYAELHVLGELARKCRDKGVGVMIEGPGHVPLNMIEENVAKEKEICDGAPFYVLGPLSTDIGAGYDHITGAIGGALAGWKGADFLCYLTPSEHLHLPEVDDVYLGVVTTRIAAHSADLARGLAKAKEKDRCMSVARKNLDWEGMQRFALDPNRIKEMRKRYPQREDRACTMCGEYCALLEEE